MTFRRISKDELEFVELQKLAEKGITEDEIEEVVSEYQQEAEAKLRLQSLEARKMEIKKEMSNDNFKNGVGGFRRG